MTTHIKATSLENEVYTMNMSMADLAISLPDMPQNAAMEAMLKNSMSRFLKSRSPAKWINMVT